MTFNMGDPVLYKRIAAAEEELDFYCYNVRYPEKATCCVLGARVLNLNNAVSVNLDRMRPDSARRLIRARHMNKRWP